MNEHKIQTNGDMKPVLMSLSLYNNSAARAFTDIPLTFHLLNQNHSQLSTLQNLISDYLIGMLSLKENK